MLLTVQVDIVRKRGENDASIPANVAEAVNFYRRDGLLHGVAQIHAADPSRTRILEISGWTIKPLPSIAKATPGTREYS